MPQVLILAAVGAAAYAGFRALARLGEHLSQGLGRSEDVRERAAAVVRHKDGGNLEYDPVSGVYRPVK